jgi:hypothetical protein
VRKLQKSDKVTWHGGDNIDLLDAEWVYVLSGGERPTLSVLTGEPLTMVGNFDLSGREPDWVVVECGVDLERCSHIAVAHFPELEGTPSERLSTNQYLGRATLRVEDAYEAHWEGEDWKLGGSYRKTSEKVEMWAENAKGKKVWLQVAGVGTPAIELRYPAIVAREIEL